MTIITAFSFQEGMEASFRDLQAKSTHEYDIEGLEQLILWALTMEEQIGRGQSVQQVMEKSRITFHELFPSGTSGCVYSWMVAVLVKHWLHGEELRCSYNSEHGYSGPGVFDPSIMPLS